MRPATEKIMMQQIVRTNHSRTLYSTVYSSKKNYCFAFFFFIFLVRSCDEAKIGCLGSTKLYINTVYSMCICMRSKDDLQSVQFKVPRDHGASFLRFLSMKIDGAKK